MDKAFFKKQMERLEKIYAGYTTDKLRAYYDELEFMAEDKLKRGIDRLIQKRQGSFFPQVAEIIHYCNTTRINSTTPEESEKAMEKRRQAFHNKLKSFEKMEAMNKTYSRLSEEKKKEVKNTAFEMMHGDRVYEGVYRIMFENHYKFRAMEKLGIDSS